MNSSPNDDYYTPEMMEKIWSPGWYNLIRLGVWFSGEEPMDPLVQIHQVYHPYACNACKRGCITNGIHTSVCSNCRVFRYCSKRCQRSDWKHHKTWCNAFSSLCQPGGPISSTTKYESFAAWREGLTLLWYLIQSKLGGPWPSRFDSQIASLQARCRKCFQAGFKMNSTTGKIENVNLTPCPKCMGVALCDACRKEGNPTFHLDCDDPEVECGQHFLSLCCLGMIVEQGNPLGLPCSTDCHQKWTPKDWVEYFARKRNDYEVPQHLFKLAPVPCFISDSHSAMLTLQHAFSLPEVAPYAPGTKLIVHLCGATMEDKYMPGRFVEMIRLNPQLTEFQIHIFGPDQAIMDTDKAVQMESIRKSCVVHVREHVGLYHDIMATDYSNEIPEPNVIFCPHPGVHDANYTSLWRPTMEYIIEKEYLLVITGCNMKEALDDANQLMDWGGHILVEPTANPFRSLRPLPDPARENGDFFYNNSSFFVAKGKKS